MKKEAIETNHQVPALERGLRILELLATRPDGMRMRELADVLNIPANSVFRITGALENFGYLERDSNDMRYRMTRKLLALGYSALGEDRLVEQSLDLMKSLRDESQETVLLGARHDVEGFVLEQVASLKAVKFLVDPGTRFPLHTSAAGKAILSALPRAERESILSRLNYKKFTARTLDSRRKLEQELEKTIALGYAVDIREEIEGLHCVGAPIFNHHGYPVAALWVTGPSFRFPEKLFPAVGRKVAAAAASISRRKGHQST